MATKYSFATPSSNANWADFLGWAGNVQGISYGLANLGTGFQVPTFILSITAVSASGTAAVYTYSGGQQLYVGQYVVVSGFTGTPGNNVSGLITAVSGTTTFTVANAVGANSDASGTPIGTFQDPYAANGQTTTWANGTTNNAAAAGAPLPLAGSNLFGTTCFPTTTNQSRVALANTKFVGNWTSGGPGGSGGYAAGNVVFSNGATGGATQAYICISAATTQVVTNTTYWSPYWMEIWKTGSGPTAIYFKIEYGCLATATYPEMSFQMGTAYLANSGTLSAAGGQNFTLTQQVIQPQGSYTASNYQCYLCGDGVNYLGLMLFAGANTQNACCFAWERGITGASAGVVTYNSLYATMYQATDGTGSGGTNMWQHSFFLTNGQGLSGTGYAGTSYRFNGWAVVAIGYPTSNVSLVVNQSTPALPIFPLPGYTGNPASVVIGCVILDISEQEALTPSVYGATHTYICSKLAIFTALYTGTSNSPVGIGFRYD